MKKVLWCGGSHLGNAKGVIESLFTQSENEYYVTATPKNRDWSKNGGRYHVNGSIVGGNASEPDRRVDLSAYSRIIFVGQFIQPQKYVRPSDLLSSSLLNAMLCRDDVFTQLPNGLFNEPLSLFPQIAKGKCTLLCDPWLRNNTLPMSFMAKFRNSLIDYCLKRDMALMFQPMSTLEREFSTSQEFSRRGGGRMHFNNEFWSIYMQTLRGELS